MKITNKACTGCGTCYTACSLNCISLKQNRLNQTIPVVDTAKCIHCGVCSIVCPQNNPPVERMPNMCYAAWSTCTEDYIYSASGGIAAQFARFQLASGGAVFGCDYDEHANLRHFRLKNSRDVRRIQSSKYSQSVAYECFADIKKLIAQKTSVVFIGTPCQVAGLKNFLKKDSPYLLTIDLVCHGTPPNSYLKQHLSELDLEEPYQKIRFRGEYDQMLTVWKNDTIIYQKDKTEDAYFIAFYQNMISYDSCYSCQYAQPKRISDITIGDFWGLGELRTIERMSERPSLILVNSEKGQDFFNRVSENLIYEQRDVAEGINGNGRLMHPPGKSYAPKLFHFIYQRKVFGFRNSVKITHRICRIIEYIKRTLSWLGEIKTALVRRVSKLLKGRSVK